MAVVTKFTRKYGLQPYGPVKPESLVLFPVDNSAGAIYSGDLVRLVADNGIDASAATNADNLGVACAFFDSTGKPITSAVASTAGQTALVNIDPQQLYMVHYYNTTTAITAADIALCADIVANASTDTDSGVSTLYVNVVTAATTAATLRILGVVPLPGNGDGWSNTGADGYYHADLIVRLQENIFTPAAASI